MVYVWIGIYSPAVPDIIRGYTSQASAHHQPGIARYHARHVTLTLTLTLTVLPCSTCNPNPNPISVTMLDM